MHRRPRYIAPEILLEAGYEGFPADVRHRTGGTREDMLVMHEWVQCGTAAADRLLSPKPSALEKKKLKTRNPKPY